MDHEQRFMRSFILGAALILLTWRAAAQTARPDRLKWERVKIARGVIWKHAHVSKLYDGPQNINVLMVNTRRRHVTLVYDKLKNRLTSDMASDVNAIAAVNAGFFDVRNGGSVTYIKVDGAVGDEDTTRWRTTPIWNGALIIQKNGRLSIEKVRSPAVYNADATFDDVLVTGSLLRDDGKNVSLPDHMFVNTKHPRTCAALRRKNRVLFITVDGRADEAAGMTLHELVKLMIILKCKEAINLDGGGSTTMWINGKGGVVNMPSDNKKFDHEGQRPVSNIIVIK